MRGGCTQLVSELRMCSVFVVVECFLILFLTALGTQSGGEETDVIANYDLQVFNITMPGVRPNKEDEYICKRWKVPDEEFYIVKLEALAEGSTVHHLILTGCPNVQLPESAWTDCHDACQGGEIMFAWAKNAPPLELPKDVGFQIGVGTKIKYLALQIHYRQAFTEPLKQDFSGIRISVTKERQKYVAGIFILLTNNLVIPAHTKEFYGDVSCKFMVDAVLHPFAFRTHAHALGRVISGYMYNGTWNLLGKGNPQWPQAFWPITEKYSIRKGDSLVARCVYDASDAKQDTMIGSTHNDEMCNFYIMYYIERSTGTTFYGCPSNDLPDLVKQIPSDSTVTLPPNAYFDNIAEGKLHEELELVDHWTTKIESGGLKFGQVTGVAVGNDGSVYVFHRGQRVWDMKSFDADNKFSQKNEGPIKEKTIVKFNATTADVIGQWADGMFYMPHGLHIDRQGNFWITDVALHQVMRFGPFWGKNSTSPELVLGIQFEPGSDDLHFCKPTDVAVLHSGEFFVADGYCNSRIMKFSKDGKLIMKWGEHSENIQNNGFPPPSTFDIPHSIVVLENRHRVCVADRENARIQCFSLDGKFIRQINPPEFKPKVFAVSCNQVTGHLFAVNGPGYFGTNATLKGFVIDVEDGLVLNSWQPTTLFHFPHDITVSPDGRFIYVVEIGPNTIWQFKVIKDQPGVHQSVKKAGAFRHPVSNGDGEVEESADDKVEDRVDELGTHFGALFVVGGLIIVPLIVMIIILIFLRMRRRGIHPMGSSRSHNRRFNLGSLLAGSQVSDFMGKDDEQRLELKHLQSDSEVEEYSSVTHQNA